MPQSRAHGEVLRFILSVDAVPLLQRQMLRFAICASLGTLISMEITQIPCSGMEPCPFRKPLNAMHGTRATKEYTSKTVTFLEEHKALILRAGIPQRHRILPAYNS